MGTAQTASGAERLAQPLPEPLVALGHGPSADITSPIVNDSGSYKNGPIILGTDTAAAGYGVEGITDGSGAGLYGHSGSGSVTSYGVYGFSPGGAGVYGYNNKAGTGVLGASVNGSGVKGETSFPSDGSPSFAQAGVFGEDLSTDGGVYDAGVAGTSTYGYGVYGTSGAEGAGVFGTTSNADGSGVIARSTSTATNSQAALIAQSYGGDAIDAFALTSTSGALIMRLDGAGNMELTGNLQVDGSCSGCAAEPAITSPGRGEQIESVGDGQLSAGSASVRIDSDFAKRLDPTKPYHVFVTPDGDSEGWLYVAEKTANGFTVRESHHGTSAIAFDYRIVGTARPIARPPHRAVALPRRLLHR